MKPHPQQDLAPLTEDDKTLSFVPLGIDTQQEDFVYVKAHSPIVVSEGFETLTRVLVTHDKHSIVATLGVIHGDWVQDGEVSLSEGACKKLKASPGDRIALSHLPPIASLSLVRAKINGAKLTESSFMQIVRDIEKGRYSNVHIASFITACFGENLDIDEITYLTRAMASTGERIDWGKEVVVDKHCVGGLPGNRTTPILVSIAAAAGLTIPKTSSKAITSPAGTADTMGTMAPVDLTLEQIKQVVTTENGCISWGGAAGLSPTDEKIIKVERALDIDSEGQMIASILSKKVAVGSTHLVIDIPVGPTAKVRSEEKAQRLKYKFSVIGKAVGLKIKVVISDGSQPVGRGIGPVLEARDVLAVLQNKPGAPSDLRERSLMLASAVFELAGVCPAGKGWAVAEDLLNSGKAWEKFYRICQAQGGFKQLMEAPYTYQVVAQRSGEVTLIDSRKLALVAKLAGAPYDKAAGVEIFVKLGERVSEQQPLFRIHSESRGELQYALNFVHEYDQILGIQ